MHRHPRHLLTLATAFAIALLAPAAQAQSAATPQVVKPPVAQLWMDVATATMPGMPEMSAMPGMGGIFGGSRGGAGYRIRHSARRRTRQQGSLRTP